MVVVEVSSQNAWFVSTDNLTGFKHLIIGFNRNPPIRLEKRPKECSVCFAKAEDLARTDW